jgi:putative transposase
MQRLKLKHWWRLIRMQRKVELCELFAQQTGNWVSRSALSRYLQKLGLNRKKKPGTVAKQGQKES